MNSMRLSTTYLTVVALMGGILSYSSCNDELPPGYNQAINPIWEYNYKVGYSGSIIPLLYKDKVIFSSFRDFAADLSSSDKLIAIDKSNGKLAWEWSDLFEDKYEQFDRGSSKAIIQNVLSFSVGSTNYAVDLNTGATVWKNRTTASFSEVGSYGNKIYRINMYEPIERGAYIDQIMEADITDGHWDQIFETTGGDSLDQGLTIPVFYKTDAGHETMMIYNNVIDETSNSLHYVSPYLINYNHTRGEVNYEILLDEPTFYSVADWLPMIYDNRVYVLVGSLMACHNIETGERIWSKRFSSNFLSGAMIKDGCIYANQEGLDYTLYSI